VHREVHDQVIAARDGKPQRSTKAVVSTLRKVEQHDGVSSGIFADESFDKNPQEWTKQALITFEDATEAYMVEVIGESNL